MLAINSLLFVPGSRPDRFAKAKAAGAGLTVIDLEDAVAEVDKGSARDAALAHLVADGGNGWAVRINAVTTAHGLADLLAILSATVRPACLLIPMVESPVEMAIVAQVLGDACPDLIPLIETPAGLSQAASIGASQRVTAMMFGGGDMAGEIGVGMTWEALAYARAAFIMAAAQARVPAIDVPWLGLDDSDGLADETGRARAIGFTAKAAIHPAQVATITAIMQPSAAEVAEAKAALAAYAAGGERAIRHNGRMLEAPIIKRYQAIVARTNEGEHA